MNEIRNQPYIQAADGQTIKVPAGFELPGTDVTVTKDGDRLIVEPSGRPVKDPRDLATLLDSWDDLDIEWPDVDQGLLPLDDIKI